MKNRQPEQLPIRIIGDEVLRKIAEPVKVIDDELRDFLEDLVFTMYKTDGVGLAAPQVGRSIRAFVIDPFWYREGHEKNPIFFLNPKFLRFEGEEGADEGCLSVPEIFEKVLRAEELTVEATNEKGEVFTMEAEGFLARVIQHENDHLDGILFIDKIPKLRRMIHAKRLRDLKSTTNEQGINLGK